MGKDNESHQCLGSHVIVDLYDATNLNSIDAIKAMVREIVECTGATLLHEHFHSFEPQGVTGVACLAESHISVHTWPEMGFAAFDIFMCGDFNSARVVPVLIRHFKPGRVETKKVARGVGLAELKHQHETCVSVAVGTFNCA